MSQQQFNAQKASRMGNMVGLIGCSTGLVSMIIVGIAFGVGWLIDNWFGFDTRYATMLLMLGSFPITLYAITKISLALVARYQAADAEASERQVQNEEKTDV